MSDTSLDAPSGETCPVCGSPLVTGTADFADIPDHTTDVDQQRAELNPGQMAQVTVCSNPDCPGPGPVGAQL